MISILDIGGNYGSLLAAFEKIGVEAVVESRDVTEAKGDAFVLPGVGRADNAMDHIKDMGWDELIWTTEKPVLGICCGFHVLCRHSEEGNVNCIGIFDCDVKKQPKARFGWEQTEGGFMYYCHLYAVQLVIHGEPQAMYHKIVSRNFTGVQFHPEKSGKAGLEFLRKWVNG